MLGRNVPPYFAGCSQTNPRLPFADAEFDIVFCSSVIEHVTGRKDTVAHVRSASAFEEQSLVHQRKFAEEIRRMAPGFAVLLPRSVQLEIWKRWPFYNHVPDFSLLTVLYMKRCFPDTEIHRESVFGLTKSIMAVRRTP